MKSQLLVLYHQIRMNFYRHRTFKTLDQSGLFHDVLRYIDPNYRDNSNRYNQSKDWLTQQGCYVPAVSLMGTKRLEAR
jgi:hypothetical protein